jgi:hypothetical protein
MMRTLLRKFQDKTYGEQQNKSQGVLVGRDRTSGKIFTRGILISQNWQRSHQQYQKSQSMKLT